MPKTGIAWTSDRMRLLAAFITPKVVDLATRRVILKEKFFKEDDIIVDATIEEIRVALMLVLEMNPRELLTANEEGVLIGCDRKKVGKMRAAA